MMESWYSFCHVPVLHRNKPALSYHPTELEFILWKGRDFGLCFEQVVIVVFCFSMLTLFSGYYIGYYWRFVRRRTPSCALSVRGIVAFALLLNSLAQLVGSFWLVPQQPYSVVLSHSVETIGWLVHIVCLLVLSWSMKHTGYGPLPLSLVWALTLLSSVLQFRTAIQYIRYPHLYERWEDYPLGYLALLIQVTSYIRFGFQIFYTVLLFIPTKPVSGVQLTLDEMRSNGVGSTQYCERRALLTGIQPKAVLSSEDIADYGTISRGRQRTDIRLEDNANFLSLLSFWWLTPLMKSGARGCLQSPFDLPMLPHSLSTVRVRELFQRTVLRLQQRQTGYNLSTNNDRNLRSLDRLSQYNPQQSVIHGAINEEDEEEAYFVMSSSSQPPDELPITTAREPTASFSLIRVLNWSFGLHYYPLGIMKLASDCLGFAGPLLLHQLVAFIEDKNEPMSHGYYYALGLFLSTLLGALLNAHFTYQTNKVGLKLKASLVTEIFRKALSVNTVSISKFSTGQIVDFMSTDTDRIVNFCSSFHQFWSLPFQIAVSLYLLYRQVGLAFLAGLAFTILLIPINRWLAIKIGKLSTAMMSQKDQRVKLMSEILNGIRVIKFYAWERNFTDKINHLRNAELESLSGRKYLDALCVYFWATTPVLISILTFTTYAAMGHKLTAAKVFTSVALFNMLISPLNAFPWVLNGLVESWVSLKRVQAFLEMTELDFRSYYLPGRVFRTVSGLPLGGESEHELLGIVDGCFTWRRKDGIDKSEQASGTSETKKESDAREEDCAIEWLLDGVNLTIRKGEFVGITGKVGSGKSSLLSAIMAEMRKKQGQVFVANLSEGFALVSQESWIQFASVRDNILFGLPYNGEKYSAVIYACALEPDLQILSAGDKTEVGENGVTLSGGQKARLALARAVYQDKEVYLLDDPLAAVDAHVASHLYTHCIMGLLRKKTRILCTHHTKFLQEANFVAVLDEGKISLTGSPNTVLPLFEGTREKRRRRSFNGRSSKGNAEEVFSTVESEHADGDDDGDNEKGDSGVLVKEEEREEGVVKLSVYRMYWESIGIVLAPIILISLLLMQASRNVSDWWLSYWVSHSQTGTSKNANVSFTSSNHLITGSNEPASDNLTFYLGIYGGLAFSNSVFTLFRAFLYAYGGIQAAKTIHKKLLSAILKAPVWFFDITPIGRIMNRFSSDLYAIDDSLPFIMNILLAQVYGLLGTLVITCYGLPWFIVVLVPLAVFYYYIQKYYRRTSRELKRLSTVTLSPIYAHFQETIMGLTTIRAMRAGDRFMSENEQRLEMNQRANYASYGVAQWLSLRLQMLGVAMVTGVSFIAVIEHRFASVNPGLVGLAISYALSVTNLLSGAVTSFTETEKEMVSVERAMQYIRGAPEEDSSTRNKPPEEWPSKGEIKFQHVVLKYREDLPRALKGISFHIKPAEKVGIVGRTGVGKTSLLRALFRIVDPLTSGTITIDGLNIATIPLECLRSAMAVIPQDPFLFSGSVRENLDLCSKFSDMELWYALERCKLKAAVKKLGGLDSEVEERGRVFSVGQRQLICLCRALLTNAKIICIDEATASVDLQTDTQIQQAIRLEFVNSTVLTIAHRIDTVLNCNRILVMEGGTVREFGSPGVLLGDSNSLFSSLYNEYQNKNR